jgi:hypothetical protein
MTDPTPQPPSLVLYQTEDGRTRIQCRFEGETLWLTQSLMAELFATTPQNVTQHLKAIYAEGELDEAATRKPYLRVRREGARRVERAVLPDAGRVSRDADDEKAHVEFERFAERRRELAEAQAEAAILKALEDLAKKLPTRRKLKSEDAA